MPVTKDFTYHWYWYALWMISCINEMVINRHASSGYVIVHYFAEVPLFRKFPEIREFRLHFRKNITMLSIVSRPNSAHNCTFQEIFIGPSGISDFESDLFAIYWLHLLTWRWTLCIALDKHFSTYSQMWFVMYMIMKEHWTCAHGNCHVQHINTPMLKWPIFIPLARTQDDKYSLERAYQIKQNPETVESFYQAVECLTTCIYDHIPSNQTFSDIHPLCVPLNRSA